MKVAAGIVTAVLVGLVGAAEREEANVYLFRASQEAAPSSAPRITKEGAAQLLLQRVSRDPFGARLSEAEVWDDELAISHYSVFGKKQQPLFGGSDASALPAQLIVILEGVSPGTSRVLEHALAATEHKPAFSVPSPPSATANERLMRDFVAAGASTLATCTLDSAVNPHDASCWNGRSTVLKIDANKIPEIINDLISALPRLSKFVSDGELEAALVLVPESSRSGQASTWTTASAARAKSASAAAAELRIRDDTETPMSDTPSASAADGAPHAWAPQNRGPIPACFQSQNACETRTDNCSGGHGRCVNRFGSNTKPEKICFACRCEAEVVKHVKREGYGETTIKWAGATCSKKDISSSFWLITGFSITIVGAVTFAIGLLVSIGQEKLPGVIGAGVSRTK